MTSHKDLLNFVNGMVVQFNEQGGPAPQVFLSTDLLTWTSLVLSSGSPGVSIASNGNVVVSVSYFGRISRGSSVATLTSLPAGEIGRVSSVAVGPVMYLVGPTNLLASSIDGGRTWTKLTLPSGASELKAIENWGSTNVAVGASGTVIRAGSSGTWAKRLSNTSSDLNDVVNGNSLWVAVGNGGTVITSEDSLTFYLQTSPTQVRLNAVAYGGAGAFVAVGQDGVILNSGNGTNWGVRGTEQAVTLHGVAYGDGRFVAVGENGITHWSTNLTVWNTVWIAGAGRLARVAFADGIFAAVEEGSARVFTSANGEIWTSTTLPGSLHYGADASAGDLWLSGENGLVWKWVAPEGPRLRVAGAFDEQKHFKLTINVPEAGNYRVYSSPDIAGTTWTAREILSIQTQGVWTDLAPAAGSVFYLVRKE